MRVLKVLAVAAALWVQPTMAATLVTSGNVSGLVGDFLVVGGLNSFDPALGQLNSITADLATTVQFAWGFAYPPQSGSQKTTANFAYDAPSTFFLSNSKGTLIPLTVNISGSGSYTWTGLAPGPNFYASGNSQTRIDPSAFGAFVGTAPFYGGEQVDVGPDGGVTYRGRGTLSFLQLGYQASVRLTYDYSPAVPEPSTWTMLIAGFCIIGAAMRRNRLSRLRRAPTGTASVGQLTPR